MVTTRAQAKFLRESLLKFPKLPAELRVRIWNEAMPRHGIYPVRLLVDVDQSSPSYLCTLRLSPIHPDQRDTDFSERIHTTRNLLMVCRESHGEVKRRFPDAIHYCDSEMRFNAKKDLLFIPWDNSLYAWMLFKAPNFSPGVVTFADAWNKVIRKLSIESCMIYASFSLFFELLPNSIRNLVPSINKFMAFLSRFADLEQLVLAAPGLISARGFHKLNVSSQGELRDRFEKVYNSGMMKGPARHSLQPPQTDIPSHMTNGVNRLKQVIQADPKTREKAESRVHHIQNGIEPLIKLGYPELSHLDVVGMVHLDPKLRTHGFGREMEFE